jgi:predicted lactoylglutathione lyase
MRSSRQRRYLVGVSCQAVSGHGSRRAFEASPRALRFASAVSYAGVFRDLDGHAWEIAFNPGLGL